MTETRSQRWDFACATHGAGRPVVLLHAFPTDSRVFAGLAELVPSAKLIAPDLPGFGDTRLGSEPPPVLSVELLADALAGWLDDLGEGPVVLGGVAIGGYTAIELADRRPDLVAALVLFGCKPAPDSPKMAPEREAVAQLARSSGSVVVADKLQSASLAPDADEVTVGIVRRMIEEADPRGIAGLTRAIAARPDPVPALRRLRVPVLVVAGEQDPYTKLDDARALAEMLPGSRFVAIPGAGHLTPLERPTEVAEALDAFVRELP